MTYYADTSFITALYLDDSHSELARRMIQMIGTILPLTQFGEFELKNAVRASVIRRAVTAEEAENTLASITQDIRNGRLAQTVWDWVSVFHAAETLSRDYTMEGGYRALDILHVAAASTLGCTHFLTFDDRQAQLAVKQGLVNLP